LTATLRPSASQAGWAWASEAAATGAPKSVNRASTGRPSDRSTSRLGLLRREGGQGVLQPAQIARDLDAEDVRPRGQHLPQFDRHRPQMLERLAQPLAGTALAAFLAGEGVQQMRQPADPHRQQGRDLARREGVVAHQHPGPAEQPQGRLDRAAHRFGRRRRRRRLVVGRIGQIAHP